MKVYKLRHPEGVQWLLPVNDDDYERLKLDGRPKAVGWKPVVMKRLTHDDKGRSRTRSDFPCGPGDGLIVSRTAMEKMSPLLERCGELLSLTTQDDEPYWILNVTTLVDALDEDKSDVLRSSSTGRILAVNKHIFDPSRVIGLQLFKLSVSPGVTYVTDEFVDEMNSSGLAGLEFKAVWELRAN